MKISREKLLNTLEMVKPGLATRGLIQQSNCFIFRKHHVVTFDGEIACRYRTPLDCRGAVQADPLISLLGKMKEKILEVAQTESELRISGKGKQAGIIMEKKITLPLDALEKPKRWKILPEKFSDAIEMVGSCAGRDDAMHYLTCINITPKWVEAHDLYQFGRYGLKMPVGTRMVLIRQLALQNIIPFNMTHISVTSNWVHFKNETGLTISCMRYMDDRYPTDLTEFTKGSGDKIRLTKSIAEACSAAEIFSVHNTKENQLLVTLQPGQMIIKGFGNLGWYTEPKKVRYSGIPITFMIAPKLLSDLVKRYEDCEVISTKKDGQVNRRLKVDAGPFVYVSSLEQPKEEEKKSKKKKRKVVKNE